MKVFLSWSGDRSFKFAEVFRDWLPNVIQACKPWLSASDIDKGARWHSELSQELQESKAGIICLTGDNLDAAWILFEAGAISKTIEKTFVCPYLLDIKPTDVKGPLAQFQSAKADKSDTLLLIKTINKALGGDGLQEHQLEKIFTKWWPDLETTLAGIPPLDDKRKKKRSERELLEEILEGVRYIWRQPLLSAEAFTTFDWEQPHVKNVLIHTLANYNPDNKCVPQEFDFSRSRKNVLKQTKPKTVMKDKF